MSRIRLLALALVPLAACGGMEPDGPQGPAGAQGPLIPIAAVAPIATAAAPLRSSLGAAFAAAASEFQVPVPVLQGLCFLEGRLSMHGSHPSIDNGFGCMHLVRNRRADTLGQAARALGVSEDLLRIDPAANIRGGAAILREEALRLSPALPTALGDWYGAVAAYSRAGTASTARMYADELYRLLGTGFSARGEDGELVTVAPQAASPNTATAAALTFAAALPANCTKDAQVDYPGAINCIVPPATFDCNLTSPCTYETSDRPTAFPLPFVVIHDVEGTAQDALNVFQDPSSAVSAHYIVDSDGTIYQVIHEKDIAYHAGNYWYNQRSVGIEHAGFDATGYQWYNATQYLASAKLVAHLCTTYKIPLDHAHLVSHGTVPGPSLAHTPNHVDPGPYWLWDYYLGLIHQQGVPFPTGTPDSRILVLHPRTDQHPYGSGGTETAANFNFFYLYTQPSTKSALIPHDTGGDITDETDNVEPDMAYYIVAARKDQGGSGDTMYKIWYGESDQLPDSKSMTGHLGWLAVPPGAGTHGLGTVVKLGAPSGAAVSIYGEPNSSATYVIGQSAGGSIYASPFTVSVSGATWYLINFNHRQAYVQASDATAM